MNTLPVLIFPLVIMFLGRQNSASKLCLLGLWSITYFIFFATISPINLLIILIFSFVNSWSTLSKNSRSSCRNIDILPSFLRNIFSLISLILSSETDNFCGQSNLTFLRFSFSSSTTEISSLLLEVCSVSLVLFSNKSP